MTVRLREIIKKVEIKKEVMKMTKNGWNEINGEEVFVIAGHIIRGTRDGRTAYRYKRNKEGAWERMPLASITYFKKGWYRMM